MTQYTWTPITVDAVVVNETYVRATHHRDSSLTHEGLVVEREDEYIRLLQEDGTRCMVDTDFRNLLRRDQALPPFPAPQVGERFTRTKDHGMDNPNCIVRTVTDFDDGWLVSYVRGPHEGIIRVHPDGKVTNREGIAPGQFVRHQVWSGPITEPVTWHPIEFPQLLEGDRVRATFTDTRGRSVTREGTVTHLNGARVQIREDNGDAFRATSLRSFEISNRVPEAPKSISDRYPTIHHLKAAIFDVVRANLVSGAWCSEAHDFVQELGIASGVGDRALRDQADEVNALITRLQGETSGGRGITSTSLEAAFETLGIPRIPTPRQKMMTLSVAVPLDMTPSQLQDYVHSLVNVTVESVEES